MAATLAAQATSGLQAIDNAFVLTNSATAPNALPLNFMWLRGPYGGADPASRIVIADVRRMNDGVFADKALLNAFKIQGATEALSRAGLLDPRAALAKRVRDADTYVPVGTNGSFPIAAYNNLPLNKQTPWGGAVSTAATNSSLDPAVGTVLGTFSNGMSLIGQASMAPGRTVLAAGELPAPSSDCGDPRTAVYGADPTTLGGLIAPKVIPGVTLFSPPRANGDISNLGVSGATYIQRMAAGDVIGAAVASGGAQQVFGVMPPVTPSLRPGTGPVSAGVTLAATGGYGAYGPRHESRLGTAGPSTYQPTAASMFEAAAGLAVLPAYGGPMAYRRAW